MFSSRLKWDSEQNPLARLLARKRAAGDPILDLTESNPTRAGFEYPADEILRVFSDPRVLSYDPNPRGLLSAREAVARYYADRGIALDPSRILLTASTSEAYSYLFKLLADPGDEILVPRPSYPLFEFLAAVESVRVRQYPLRYDGSWHIDFAALERLVTPGTRAIVIVNPNNPTGSYLKHDEWPRLAAFGLPILSDEVFADFAFAPDPSRIATLAGLIDGGRVPGPARDPLVAHVPDSDSESGFALGGRVPGPARDPLVAHSADVLTFSMSGLSKIAGLPQMKLGWIVAGGPGHEAALSGLEWIADTFLSVSTPVQIALPKLLEASQSVRRQMLDRTCANLGHLRAAIDPASPCRILNTEGGWYAILQIPRTRSEEEWTLDLLNHSGVLVQPGFFYDFESEAFLVLSLLTAPEIFHEGVRRILDRVR